MFLSPTLFLLLNSEISIYPLLCQFYYIIPFLFLRNDSPKSNSTTQRWRLQNGELFILLLFLNRAKRTEYGFIAVERWEVLPQYAGFMKFPINAATNRSKVIFEGTTWKKRTEIGPISSDFGRTWSSSPWTTLARSTRRGQGLSKHPIKSLFLCPKTWRSIPLKSLVMPMAKILVRHVIGKEAVPKL